ncbi:hypothetical protein N9Z12_01820 [Opitutaceae bacterium]|nr:hypothetical protein [Opitutaceae bacterium]
MGWCSVAVSAKPDWQDVRGTKIKGSPVEVLGPFALFRDGAKRGNRVLLRGLSEDVCRRFYEETAKRSELGPTFAEATGSLTRLFDGRVSRVRDEKLVPADLSGQAEPELLVVLYGHPHNGNSWRGLRNFESIYHRLKRVLGERVEFIFFGAVNDSQAQMQIATKMHMPWLIADAELGRRARYLADLARSKETQLMVISRNGAPIISGHAEDLESTLRFIDELGGLAGLMNSANPKSWKDRQHYFGAIRGLPYAQKSTGPEMLGNPLNPVTLREYGVGRIAADLTIAESGKIEHVELLPDSIVPENLKAPLSTAIQRSGVFLPAYHNGEAKKEVYHYELAIPPEDVVAEADAAWLSGETMHEVILNDWFLLRPIQVPESNFSNVSYTDQDGVMVMQAFEVSDTDVTKGEQMSAFTTNWFDEAGASSVNPIAEKQVRVDGTLLEWEEVTGELGLIDFQKGIGELEYTIGYGWIEFEVPTSKQAWLGIGSDDGIKIWHNGELVHDKWIRRNSLIDDDIVPLKLTAGRNTLMVKIQNAWGDWSFISRLRIRAK